MQLSFRVNIMKPDMFFNFVLVSIYDFSENFKLHRNLSVFGESTVLILENFWFVENLITNVF